MSSQSLEDIKSKFSNIKNLDQLLKTIKTDLVSFVEQHTKTEGTNLEKTSVLSCTKKISKEKGQDAWAFFCSIINFSVKVQKFMIPMLNGIAKSIITYYKGDFIAFLNSDVHSKKVLLQNFKWQWVSKDGKTVNQTGWSHHRILKTYQLVYILQTLKVIVNENQSFEANAKKIYQESKNFVEFVSKFVECFRGEPRIFGNPKLTSQKCFNREEDEGKKQLLRKIFEEKVCTGSYSLTFLKVIKNFSTILDPTDKITFHIKTDTPLKAELTFKKLKKSRLTNFLAPRVPEDDFEEDDNDFEPNDNEEELEDNFEPIMNEDELDQTEEE